jgi:predicted Zn-dependent protease
MPNYALNNTRWSPTHTTVTWSIATQNFAGQPGGAFSRFISDQIIVNDIINAFAQWDAASGLSFQRVADSASVDIRLGYGVLDGNAGSTIGQAARQWNSATNYLTHVTVRFDSDEHYFTQGNEVYIDNLANPITSVALHEIGHGLGLAHYNGEEAVMNDASGTNITLKPSDPATTARRRFRRQHDDDRPGLGRQLSDRQSRIGRRPRLVSRAAHRRHDVSDRSHGRAERPRDARRSVSAFLQQRRHAGRGE